MARCNLHLLLMVFSMSMENMTFRPSSEPLVRQFLAQKSLPKFDAAGSNFPIDTYDLGTLNLA